MSFGRSLWLVFGDQFIQGKVHNLSAGGVQVKVDAILEPRQTLELNLARFGVMPVRAIWSNDDGMGACFLDATIDIFNRIGHLLPGMPDGKSLS